MHESLKHILDIQELDIKMIRLMRIKKQRKQELEQIGSLRKELGEQLSLKEQEISDLNRQVEDLEKKVALETQASNILDKKVAEEEILDKIKGSLKTSQTNSEELEKEIATGIEKINEEGQSLKKMRDAAVEHADPEILQIYERLLRNKKDRVIVPIENRTCSGCHITLTIQHENLVRKGDSLVFCEHCARIHYWQEAEAAEGITAPVRRRRRTVKA